MGSARDDEGSHAAWARRGTVARFALPRCAVIVIGARPAADQRPGSRAVTSCNSHLLPSGSLNVANDP